MWIVIINETVRHSAWTNFQDATSQMRVLKDSGYKSVCIRRDQTVSCENGHYYV